VKLLQIVLVCVVVMMLAVPVAAQDVQMPAVGPGDQYETLAANLFALIYNATYLPFAAGMVTLLTALSKRVKALGNVQSNVLALFWTVIVWALWTGANEIGYGALFESVTSTLTTLGVAVLGVTGTAIASGKLYQVSAAQNVALVGYSRPVVEKKETE
jgi:hypothetical protein